MAAWPELPDAIRAGILVLVRASSWRGSSQNARLPVRRRKVTHESHSAD